MAKHRSPSFTQPSFLARWGLTSLEALEHPGKGALQFVVAGRSDHTLTALGFEQLKEDLAGRVGMPIELFSRPCLEDSPNPWRRRRLLSGQGGRAQAVERLEDIRIAAGKLTRLVRSATFAQLLNDPSAQDTLVRWMQQLAAGVTAVAERFQRSHPEIPWRAWAHMGQRLSASGAEADWPLLWATVQSDVPLLLRLLDRPDPPAARSKRPATRSPASGTMKPV